MSGELRKEFTSSLCAWSRVVYSLGSAINIAVSMNSVTDFSLVDKYWKKKR
jgi:hypothetical protein